MADLSPVETPAERPSIHPKLTKSYAIDQITDIEQLRAVAHRMWEAFFAAHKQAAHIYETLTELNCQKCLDAYSGEREDACEEYRKLQRKVSDGFGSV